MLFFGSFWPDARATGAGVRTTSLLSSGFLGEFGYNAATFASPQRENESSRRLRDDLGVRTMRCPINRREELGRMVDEVAPSGKAKKAKASAKPKARKHKDTPLAVVLPAFVNTASVKRGQVLVFEGDLNGALAEDPPEE